MNNDESINTANINITYLTLRKIIGGLGILMPFVLIAGNGGKVENSISHYYYTNMSVVFTGILISFGLILISYKGFSKKENEFLSDNLITNIAGVLAIIVAIVPTACDFCDLGFPNGHSNHTIGLVHFISAGLFIVIMGYMSFNQFSKSEIVNRSDKIRHIVYKTCGVVIWVAMLFLISIFVFKYDKFRTAVFWGEAIALVCFGVSWLVKSKALSEMGILNE